MGFLRVANVIVVVISTVDGVHIKYSFYFFEMFSVLVFTVKYLLRLYTCTVAPLYQHPFMGRLKYALKPLVIVDLFSILPFYLPFTGIYLRVFRVLRRFRIMRIFKLERYVGALSLIVKVFYKVYDELVATVIVLSILLVLFTGLMYYIEPETFHNIPEAMWWGIVTPSTVGYGDMYLHTLLGKFIVLILTLLEIGLFGLPAAIIGIRFY